MNKMRFLAALGIMAAVIVIFASINDSTEAQRVSVDEVSKTTQPPIFKSERLCATDHDPAKIDLMETDFAIRQKELKDSFADNISGGVINVYFHVVNKGSGISNGDVTTQMINDQMNVLNSAFASWGWSFNLISVDRTTNSTWYANCYGSSEAAMKGALRAGFCR